MPRLSPSPAYLTSSLIGATGSAPRAARSRKAGSFCGAKRPLVRSTMSAKRPAADPTKTHVSYGFDCIAACIHLLEILLMPSAGLDLRLVRYPHAVPYKDRQQRDRDADERGPDEEPDEARMLDHEARKPSQNSARKGAERRKQAELARRML